MFFFMVLLCSSFATDDYDTIVASKYACFNNKYQNISTFTAPKNGTIYGIKLRYINSSASSVSNGTYWEYPLQTFMFHMKNSNESEIYYPVANTQNVNLNESICNKDCIYSYTIQNYNANNSINYTLLNPAYNVSTNDEFMLQYSDICCADNFTNITTCAAIYFLYSNPTTSPTIPPTASPTIEPTSTVSEFGIDITIEYHLTLSNIETKTLIGISRETVTANLSTHKATCITGFGAHPMHNITSETLTITYEIKICNKTLQQSLYEQYNNNLKQWLLYNINTTTNININSNEIVTNIIATDSNEAANPTEPMITPRNSEDINPTHNSKRYSSSQLDSHAVVLIIVAVIFIIMILAIGIYLKRKAIVVQLTLKDLKFYSNDDKSRELLRCDTLPPTSSVIFEDKRMVVSNESFESISNPNDSLVPGSVKRLSSVKLSVVRYDDRMDGFYVKAITDYNNDGEDQLNFKENAIFWIVETTASGWWYGIDEMGYDGWVPSNYVVKLDKQQKAELQQQQQQKTSGESYISLLTELMDKSYNKVKANGIRTDNIPGAIAPPMNVTGGEDNFSSSSSDEEMNLHKTIGSRTRSDKY